jgi:hypothetical protein
MFSGKLLERGSVDDLLASKTLEALYFGGQKNDPNLMKDTDPSC